MGHTLALDQRLTITPSRDAVELLAATLDEPAWLRDHRLTALATFESLRLARRRRGRVAAHTNGRRPAGELGTSLRRRMPSCLLPSFHSAASEAGLLSHSNGSTTDARARRSARGARSLATPALAGSARVRRARACAPQHRGPHRVRSPHRTERSSLESRAVLLPPARPHRRASHSSTTSVSAPEPPHWGTRWSWQKREAQRLS